MAHWYILNGPFDRKAAANRGRNLMIGEDGYSPIRLRVARLRDRTGPSVAARLAALEAAIGEPVCVGCGGNVGHHKAPDGGGCSGWFPTVREHLARLETEHAALVVRVGELERLPSVAEERESDDDAPVRPEPGSVADPDRLAKVAHEATDEELGQRVRAEYWGSDEAPGAWGELREWQRADYTRAGKALYNLGREHGRADADAAIDMLRGQARPSAPTPIAHVPTESAGADGARIQSEAEMAAELEAADWYVSRVTYPDGERVERWTNPTGKRANAPIRDAHAAMRAAKGTHPDLFEALKRSLEPSLSEKEAFLRSKGWTDEGPYGWHCPGVEGTSDTHKAYALAKGAK